MGEAVGDSRRVERGGGDGRERGGRSRGRGESRGNARKKAGEGREGGGRGEGGEEGGWGRKKGGSGKQIPHAVQLFSFRTELNLGCKSHFLQETLNADKGVVS